MSGRLWRSAALRNWCDGRMHKALKGLWGEAHPQSVDPTLASRGRHALENFHHSGAHIWHAAIDIR